MKFKCEIGETRINEVEDGGTWPMVIGFHRDDGSGVRIYFETAEEVRYVVANFLEDFASVMRKPELWCSEESLQKSLEELDKNAAESKIQGELCSGC